ncbi:hypothetical protein BH23VER1_BH23VER1_05550 [soil metagenome]
MSTTALPPSRIQARFFPLAPLAPLAALALAFTVSPRPASAAEGTRPDAELRKHPAAQVVVRYLANALGHDWQASTALIEPRSLAGVQRAFVERVKLSPTIDDEMNMIARVGKTNLDQIEEMTPSEFYLAYHSNLQTRLGIDRERNAMIAESLGLTVLSVGEEPASNLAHVLVRTVHRDGDKLVRNLELISLVKTKGADGKQERWLVSLDQQQPQVTAIEPDAETPAKKPR